MHSDNLQNWILWRDKLFCDFLLFFYYLDYTKCKFPDFSLTFPNIHFFPWPSTKFPDFCQVWNFPDFSLTAGHPVNSFIDHSRDPQINWSDYQMSGHPALQQWFQKLPWYVLKENVYLDSFRHYRYQWGGEAWTNWPTFCRWHFQIHSPERTWKKFLYFH